MCKFPLPAELIAVVGGTLASSIFNLGENHNVNLVGDIPMGLPLPELPPVKLLWLVAIDTIAIAIVSIRMLLHRCINGMHRLWLCLFVFRSVTRSPFRWQ